MLSDEGARRVGNHFAVITKLQSDWLIGWDCPDSLLHTPYSSTMWKTREEVTIHRRRRVNSFVNSKCSLVRIIDPG